MDETTQTTKPAQKIKKEEKKTIYQKLLEVQKEVGVISKEQTNPFYNSSYFDINQLLKAIKPVLSKQGLVILQPIIGNSLETQIIDSDSGDKITSSITLPEIADPQKLGGAITYFRRYSLQSFLSLEAEDDDGNSVTNIPVKEESNIQTCPSCNKQHTGKYALCYDCWKSGQSTKVIANPEKAPF